MRRQPVNIIIPDGRKTSTVAFKMGHPPRTVPHYQIMAGDYISVAYWDTRATYPFVEFLSPESAAALFRVKGML